jgi:hypothetical protein
VIASTGLASDTKNFALGKTAFSDYSTCRAIRELLNFASFFSFFTFVFSMINLLYSWFDFPTPGAGAFADRRQAVSARSHRAIIRA